MKNEINIDSWNRKEHFHFFSKFEEPFFGITAELDCTHAYKESKENSNVQEAVQALTADGVNGLVKQQLAKQKSTFDQVIEGIYHTILLCCIGAALYIFIPIIWTKYHVRKHLTKQ